MKLVKHYDFTKMRKLHEDWNIRTGEKWFNYELQHYVDKKENLYFDNGLVINATYQNGIYESARIDTRNNFFFKHGRIEIVAKIPKGVGTWPALWMMPQESKYGHWPKSGEIDIMEHVGRDLDKLFLCLHSEAHNHNENSNYFEEYVVEGLTDDFHTFSMDWSSNYIAYILDDKEIASFHKGQEGFDPSTKGWPFNEDFYLIINLAIGGKFGGEVDPTCFPQKFIIKDVKIYQ